MVRVVRQRKRLRQLESAEFRQPDLKTVKRVGSQGARSSLDQKPTPLRRGDAQAIDLREGELATAWFCFSEGQVMQLPQEPSDLTFPVGGAIFGKFCLQVAAAIVESRAERAGRKRGR